MTGPRDIDRTLDVWFVDGPSVMPDRLFDAVLDQVERTPQRPFARLRLRLNDMNPRLRYFTVAATALLAVIAAVVLIGGGSKSPVLPTASPEPSATAAADVPQELRALWMGGTRSITGLDADAGVSLMFSATGTFSMNGSLTDRPDRMQSSVEILGPDTVRLVTDNATQDCGAGDAGEYTWSMSTSGETLELVAETDTCASRLEAVPGTYWRMDCPTVDDNCIGTVDAGTYESQFLDPFVAPGDEWTPRFGALTYTVPGGWVNRGDWPAEFALAPAGAPATTHVTIVSDVVVASRADNCSEEQDPDAGTTAEEIVAALSRPGVTVSTPVPVDIGGLSGLRVDLALDDSWTTPCPWSEDRPYAMLFVDRPAEEGFAWGLDGDLQMRTYLLNVEEDRAILIDIESASEADHAAFVDEATAVVESFVFTP